SYCVRFIAVRQALDTDASNPSSRLMLTILAGVAEFEREIIRERTLAGVHAARAAGKTLGRPRRVFRRDQVARMRAGGPELARDSCRARPTCFHCARGHQRRSLLASSGILPWSAFVGLIREVGVLKLPPIRLLARVAARSALWRYTSMSVVAGIIHRRVTSDESPRRTDLFRCPGRANCARGTSFCRLSRQGVE